MKKFRKGLAVILCLTFFVASVVYAIDINSDYDYDAKAVFADVPTDYWAYSQIASLAGNGVFSGDVNNMFHPDSYITKEQTAEVISKFMKLEPYTEGEFVYSDVTADSPYCEYAYAANEFFPIKEDVKENHRLFEGDKILTREELCYSIVHMIYAENEAVFSNVNGLKKYDDFEAIDEDLAPYVAVMLDKELLPEYDDNKIRPDDPVSKADLAVVLFECVTPRIYASVTQNGVEVLQQYNEEDVLKISVKKFGTNALADFYSWSFKKPANAKNASVKYYENGFGVESRPWESIMSQRDTEKLSSAKSEDRNEASSSLFYAPFKTSCTDYFSPYVVRALTNIDGDSPDTYDFTGGYHTYSRMGTSKTATARNAEMTVKVNGVEVEDEFHGKATYIDIITVNYIQASNTRKTDGSGREVLKETRHLHFDGDKWNFTIETEALEKVEVYEYYGAQFDLSGVGDKITFISDDYCKTHVVGNERIQSPDENCKKIVIEGKKLDTEIAVDFTLPTEAENNRGFSSFYESYGKSYFNSYFSLTSPMNMEEGEKITVKGYYKFSELDENWKDEYKTDDESETESVDEAESPVVVDPENVIIDLPEYYGDAPVYGDNYSYPAYPGLVYPSGGNGNSIGSAYYNNNNTYEPSYPTGGYYGSSYGNSAPEAR